ncbi:hypothetical protein U472_06140 [Orenia metallireducens]|uniref:histidine kinase n=1 Tax=Orenia metallireducens TaxID=1413210 RepID=A0A1C0A9V1_9FIRM|nr:PAS domain-containing sensor histidine kinase [Orenia metallireducens]OCL27061.1 hypothetical protein U472_06140 [Orenia metallireducens]
MLITKKIYLLILFLIILNLTSYAKDLEDNEILILNSYYRGDSWEDDITETLMDGLGSGKNNIHIEYIDIHHANSNYFEKLYNIYKYKYQNYQFDLIIVCDNAAFDFLYKYQEVLFPQTPVIFCGVNNFDDTVLKEKQGFTGIVEKVDLIGTIDIALQLHPDADKVVLFVDGTSIGSVQNYILEEELLNYNDKIKYEIIRTESIVTAQRKVRRLSEDDIIILAAGFNNNCGNRLSAKDTSILLANNSQAPIYSVWDFFLGHGIVGGKLINGHYQGRVATALANKVLSGEDVNNIPIIKESPNLYMFDYKEMKKFEIKISNLPPKSIVINKNESFFVKNKDKPIFQVIIFSIIILLCLVVILGISIFKYERVEKELLLIKEDLEDKVAERTIKLELEKGKLQSYLDMAEVVFVVLDLEQKVTMINKKGCELLGYNREEILGKNWFDNFINQNDRRTIYRKTSKEEDIVITKTTENFLVSKNGKTRILIWHNSILRDKDGKITGTVSSGVDVTKERLLEERLEKSIVNIDNLLDFPPELRKPLSLIFSSLHILDISEISFVIIDKQKRVVMVNQAAQDIFGYNREEIIGVNMLDFIKKDKRDEIYQLFDNILALKLKLPLYIEITCLTKDGREIIIAWYTSVLKDDNGVVQAIFSTGIDITERKLLEDKLQYNKLKVEFFANLTHELKTPLNLIFSATQMLEIYHKKNLPAKEMKDAKKYLTIIKQNGYRQLRLVDNLVDITKINSNSFKLNLQNRDIVEVIRKITLSTAEYIKNKDRSLEFNSQIDEKIIPCDLCAIERIILNLLSNAVKFTNEGDKIFVRVYQEDDKVMISIQDNGIGIETNKLDLIFDKFRQVDKSFSRNTEGSGIGLAIVKLLIELHNGSLKVESEYGKGSNFIIGLPDIELKEKNGEIILNDENNIDNLDDRIKLEFSDVYGL